jgi:hypothetical protein
MGLYAASERVRLPVACGMAPPGGLLRFFRLRLQKQVLRRIVALRYDESGDGKRDAQVWALQVLRLELRSVEPKRSGTRRKNSTFFLSALECPQRLRALRLAALRGGA